MQAVSSFKVGGIPAIEAGRKETDTKREKSVRVHESLTKAGWAPAQKGYIDYLVLGLRPAVGPGAPNSLELPIASHYKDPPIFLCLNYTLGFSVISQEPYLRWQRNLLKNT